MELGGGRDDNIIGTLSGSDGQSTGSFTGSSVSERDDEDISINDVNDNGYRNGGGGGGGGINNSKAKINKDKRGGRNLLKSGLCIDDMLDADSHLLINLDRLGLAINSGGGPQPRADSSGRQFTLDEVSYDRGLYHLSNSSLGGECGEEKRLYVVDERGKGRGERGGRSKHTAAADGGALTLSSLKKHNDWAAANGIMANPIALLQQSEGGYSYKALVENSVAANDFNNKDRLSAKVPPNHNHNNGSKNNHPVKILKNESNQHSKNQQQQQQQQPPRPLQQVKIMTRNSESFAKSTRSTQSAASLADNIVASHTNSHNVIIAASLHDSSSSAAYENHHHTLDAMTYSNDVVEDIYNTLNFDDADGDDDPFAGSYSNLDSALMSNKSSSSNINILDDTTAAAGNSSNDLNDLSVFQGIALRVDAPEFTPSFLLSPQQGAANGSSGKKGRSRGGRRVRRGDKAREKIVIDFAKLQTPASKG